MCVIVWRVSALVGVHDLVLGKLLLNIFEDYLKKITRCLLRNILVNYYQNRILNYYRLFVTAAELLLLMVECCILQADNQYFEHEQVSLNNKCLGYKRYPLPSVMRCATQNIQNMVSLVGTSCC